MATSGKPVLDMRFDAEPSAPRQARSAVAARYGEHLRCGDILVCVSEAVTNAVLHARTPLRFVVSEVGRRLRIEVTDEDPTLPVVRDPDPGTPTGRGLLLIDRLSTSWGVESRADGKTLWFEMT